MKRGYLTKSFAATRKLGEKMAKDILKNRPQGHAFIIALQGDLGSGKTTFAQGFAKGLGVKEKITSPTFLIIKRFKIGKRGRLFSPENFYHIDCYRLRKPQDLLGLKFKEIISSPENIIAIEWPEKIKEILPKKFLRIKFKFIDKNKRKIIF